MAMERILGTETGKSAFEKTDRNVVALDDSLTADKLDLATHKADNTSAHGINLYAKKVQGNNILATLQNGWVGSFNYIKNDLGQVLVRCDLIAGTVAPITIVTSLPEGYRPINNVILNLTNPSGAGNFMLYIHSSGNVYITSNSTFINADSYNGQVMFATE